MIILEAVFYGASYNSHMFKVTENSLMVERDQPLLYKPYPKQYKYQHQVNMSLSKAFNLTNNSCGTAHVHPGYMFARTQLAPLHRRHFDM